MATSRGSGWIVIVLQRNCFTITLAFWCSIYLFIFLSLVESAIMSVNIHINSPNVHYTDTHITARYSYQTTSVHTENSNITVSFEPFEMRIHASASSADTNLSVWDVGEPLHHRDDVPHGEACAPSGCHARGLGRQQRDHCHGRCPGQQTGPYLENQDWAEGEQSLCAHLDQYMLGWLQTLLRSVIAQKRLQKSFCLLIIPKLQYYEKHCNPFYSLLWPRYAHMI